MSACGEWALLADISCRTYRQSPPRSDCRVFPRRNNTPHVKTCDAAQAIQCVRAVPKHIIDLPHGALSPLHRSRHQRFGLRTGLAVEEIVGGRDIYFRLEARKTLAPVSVYPDLGRCNAGNLRKSPETPNRSPCLPQRLAQRCSPNSRI